MPSSLVNSANPGQDHDGQEVWDHLDQFLLQLQAATDVSRRIRATLDMVRRATHAGAVFLCTGANSTVSEYSGPAIADLDAHARLARDLLTGVCTSENYALRTELNGTKAGLPAATSAAFVRLSRTRNAWIVALRFGPA